MRVGVATARRVGGSWLGVAWLGVPRIRVEYRGAVESKHRVEFRGSAEGTPSDEQGDE